MNLSEKLTNKLLKMEIIDDEEKDLYYYGFRQGFFLLLNVMTVITIGIIYNMIWQVIIFIITYSLLRAYAGGYHASTQLRCYLFSVGMITSVLWLIKMIPWNGFMCLMITVVSSLTVLLIAPVEDSNKPLEQKEKEVFRKRTNIILGVLTVFSSLIWFMGGNQISICIVMGMFMNSVMLVLGKFKIE